MIRKRHHQTDADNQATLEPHRQHQYKHDDDDGFDQVDDKRSQRIPHTLGLIEYFMAIYSGRQTVIFQLRQLRFHGFADPSRYPNRSKQLPKCR